jgi:hypothetical protein
VIFRCVLIAGVALVKLGRRIVFTDGLGRASVRVRLGPERRIARAQARSASGRPLRPLALTLRAGLRTLTLP